jgi:ketohexokinase
MYAIICVGAIYLDTILVVPHYPEEDKKLRATNLLVRRGGNCGNTLEVLEQLVYRESLQVADREDRTASEDLPLYLISVLPNKSSDAAASIQASFRHVKLDATCIYRQGSNTAASSYIIRSDETGSRTIVSYNGLEEMTTSEFEHRATLAVSQARDGQAWFHFEVSRVTLVMTESSILTSNRAGYQRSH